MAKDRDRRYQTPEHLVRDLLGVAGAVGLATTSAPLPSWLDEAHRPAWERHLVWLVPVLGFMLVVAGLAWWGREPSSASAQRSSGRGAPSGHTLAGPARRAPAVVGARKRPSRPIPPRPIPAISPSAQ